MFSVSLIGDESLLPIPIAEAETLLTNLITAANQTDPVNGRLIHQAVQTHSNVPKGMKK